MKKMQDISSDPESVAYIWFQAHSNLLLYYSFFPQILSKVWFQHGVF